MAGNRIVSDAAILRIKELAAVRDNKGRKVYSNMKIATMLGIGETTVFRILNHQAAYASAARIEVKSEERLNAEAQDSLKRLLADPTMQPFIQKQEAPAPSSLVQKLNETAATAPAATADKLLGELDGKPDDKD